MNEPIQQNEGMSLGTGLAIGAGIELGSTAAEQFVGLKLASKIPAQKWFKPTAAMNVEVGQQALNYLHHVGHKNVKNMLWNYGSALALDGFGLGVGLWALNSNKPKNGIQSNSDIGSQLGMAALGGGILGAITGAKGAAIMSLVPKGIQDFAKSDQLGNYIQKKQAEIDKRPNSIKQDKLDSIKDGARRASESADEAIQVAKEIRDKALKFEPLKKAAAVTDKAMGKLYHMRGRSAAMIGGATAIGGLMGAGYKGLSE
jgi:hypothetical protein